MDIVVDPGMPWFAPSYNVAPQSTQPVVRLNRDSSRRENLASKIRSKRDRFP